jgi:uncharacterized protein (TIGR02680 family)
MSAAAMRWRLERAGIINLFDYANEEFVFDDGRLILKGPNGSGKSKAIEVLFPFLFDGDMSPTKLDPFGKKSRKMKWNLLMEKHDFRVGYVWATVVHDDPEHSPRRVSFGACLEAHKDWPDVRSRFFVVEDNCPRVDFDLVGPDNRPLRKEKLTELIRPLGGDDFTEARLYRERLNELLFGFQTQERMQQWIRLLRVLRKPQLSDNLNEEELNALLSAALPEIDVEYLESASRRLDQIDESRRTHETLQKNTDAVNEFGIMYARYARAELRERSEQLQMSLTALDRTTADLEGAEHDLAGAEEREQQLSQELERLEGLKTRLNSARDELNRSQEMRAAREIEQTRAQVTDLEAQLQRSRTDLDDAHGDQRRKEERLREEQEKFEQASAEVGRLLAQAATLAQAAGIADHETLAAGLDGDNAIGLLAEQMLRLATERTRVVARARELRQQKETLARIAAQRSGEHAEAKDKLDNVRSERIELDEALTEARDSLVAANEGWLRSLHQLSLGDKARQLLLDAAAVSGEPGARPLTEIVHPTYRASMSAIDRERATLSARVAQLRSEQAPLRSEINDLEAEVDPEPVPLRTRSRDIDRAGAPLWKLIDWRDSVGEDLRAGVEGALEGAGALDAWVLPDGTVLDLADDVELVPHPITGSTLCDVLRPAAPNASVDPGRVAETLSSIGYGQSAAPFNVNGDGGFTFGPVQGCFRKPRAEFIGASARAETRRQRIESLNAKLAVLDHAVAECETAAELLTAAEAQAGQEFSALPAESSTRKAFAALEYARRQEEAARAALDEAARRTADADRESDMADGDLELHCDRNGLPRDADPAKLEACEQKVAVYTGSANELRLVDGQRAAALALVDERSGDVALCQRRAVAAGEAVRGREQQLNTAQGRLEALAVVSEGAERALARLVEIDNELQTNRERELKLQSQKEDAIRQTGGLRIKVESGRQAVKAAYQALAEALETVRAFAGAELLPLALERAAVTLTAEAVQTWDAREWSTFLASLPTNALQSRGNRENLLNQLDQSYEILGQEIDSTQLQLSRERVGGLVIVRPRMNGEQHSFASLVSELSAQVVESEQRLSEQDRQLFEDFVTGGLVDHLRIRISEAHHSVQRMKDEISRVEASSGMSIGISWKRRDDDSAVLKRALELLQHSPAKLSDDDREALSGFIRAQIADARLSAAENETTAKQLERALDYRNWHRFVITKSNRRRGIGEHEMTKHAHETGSGGEKAIALHLPLLAAAASYPTSARPDALRLVILDEAFTRIDDEGRRGLMAMMVAFDLDIVLTSPDFWGCYREVPGLSIYQLAPQDPDHPGVVARHFVWNGRTRREIEDDDLSHAA